MSKTGKLSSRSVKRKLAQISIVRDSKNIKKLILFGECLEFYTPKKFAVEPAGHRNFNTGIKVTLSEEFVGIITVILRNIKVENCRKIQGKKRRLNNTKILDFLNAFFVKKFSIDRNDLVGILIITNKNKQPFKIKHTCE